MEIDHQIFFSVTDSRRAVVSYKKKYVHGVLVSLPRKSVVTLSDRLDITIPVDWDVKPKPIKQNRGITGKHPFYGHFPIIPM